MWPHHETTAGDLHVQIDPHEGPVLLTVAMNRSNMKGDSRARLHLFAAQRLCARTVMVTATTLRSRSTHMQQIRSVPGTGVDSSSDTSSVVPPSRWRPLVVTFEWPGPVSSHVLNTSDEPPPPAHVNMAAAHEGTLESWCVPRTALRARAVQAAPTSMFR